MAHPSDNKRPKDTPVVLGKNTNTGKDITITDEERIRHISVVGATGTHKSTLLSSVALQAAEKEECVIVFAVERDILDNLLIRFQQESMNNVILLDFSDRRRSLGIHYTAWERDIERCIELLKRLWKITDETPNLENTLRASLLTLQFNNLPLDRMPDLLRDKAFRASCMARIPDTLDGFFVREFWEKDFNKHEVQFQIRNADSTLNKILQMFMDKYIAYIIGQMRNTLHVRKDILDKKKILLIYLPKNDLKKIRVRRIGAMILEELQHALFSRADLPIHERHIVTLICDEWQLYLTPDFFEDVLSQGRRYSIAAILATQTLEYFDSTLQAILDQVGTHITFAVGVKDVYKLAPFYAKDPPPAETRKEPVLKVHPDPLYWLCGNKHQNNRVNEIIANCRRNRVYSSVDFLTNLMEDQLLSSSEDQRRNIIIQAVKDSYCLAYRCGYLRHYYHHRSFSGYTFPGLSPKVDTRLGHRDDNRDPFYTLSYTPRRRYFDKYPLPEQPFLTYPENDEVITAFEALIQWYLANGQFSKEAEEKYKHGRWHYLIRELFIKNYRRIEQYFIYGDKTKWEGTALQLGVYTGDFTEREKQFIQDHENNIEDFYSMRQSLHEELLEKYVQIQREAESGSLSGQWVQRGRSSYFQRRILPPDSVTLIKKADEGQAFREFWEQITPYLPDLEKVVNLYLYGLLDTDPVMKSRQEEAWQEVEDELHSLQQIINEVISISVELAELATLLAADPIMIASGQYTEKSGTQRSHADMEKEKEKELLQDMPDGIAYVSMRMRGGRFTPRMETKHLDTVYPRVGSLENRHLQALDNAIPYTTDARTIDQEFWKRRQRFGIAPSPVMQPPQVERQTLREEQEYAAPVPVLLYRVKRRVSPAKVEEFLPTLTFDEDTLSNKDKCLMLLYHFHYLTVKQAARLLGKTSGSQEDKVGAALLKEYKNGLLQRKEIIGITKAGNVPFVYSLSDRGMEYLEDKFEVSSGTRKGTFSEHTLKVNDALITLVLATKQETSIRLVGLKHERTFAQQKIPVGDGSLQPDGFLHFQLSPPFGVENESVGVCLEIDLRSEVWAQWQEKVNKYLKFASGAYQKKFGVESLTIAVCCPSGNTRSLRKWTKEALELQGKTEYADLFLFTDRNPAADDCDPVEWVTAPVWTDINNTPYALIEKSQPQEQQAPEPKRQFITPIPFAQPQQPAHSPAELQRRYVEYEREMINIGRKPLAYEAWEKLELSKYAAENE